MLRPASTVALLLVLAGPTAATAGAGLSMDDPVTIEECDARAAERPDELDSYLCYWIVARKSGRQEVAARRLEALLARDPGNHRATLYLALIRGDQIDPGALALARRAAEGLAADGDIVGEARAQVLLDSFLRYRGAIEEADAALARALELARLSGDPELLAQAETARAWTSLSDGDYSLAWSLYRKLEGALFPDGPSWLQYRVLRGLGRAARATGRLHRSFGYFRRSAELVESSGNLYAEALDRFFLAEAAAELRIAGEEMPEDEVLRLTDDALRVARVAGNGGAEGLILLLRARQRSRDLPARLADAREGLALLRRTDEIEDIGSGLRLLASLLVEEDAAAQLPAALRLVDEAIDLARTGGWPGEIARAYLARAALGAGRLPRPEVIADYLTAIEQIETMRDLQSNRQIRGRILWDWASAYYRLARFALEVPGTEAENDLDLAFATIERLRGRLLGDLLDAARATESAFPAGPQREAFVALRARIAGAQRRLLSPGLSPAERRAAHADLERLEMEEAYHVTRLGRARPAYATLSPAQIPTIERLQRTLDTDQALIAYQIAIPDESGARHSWAVVLTREGRRVHPLPDGERLEERIAVFTGLLHRRDALEAEAAARLYDDLLAAPLRGVGGGITRLVIIPDGALHRLPFAALREGPGREPLAARFEISLVPSASLWSYLKETAPGPAGAAVLAFADPALPGAGEAAPAAERSASLGDGVVLGPLPHARREARAVVRRIGGDSLLLLGDRASEHSLKSSDLSRFGILHFATHAVVDESEPQRSAIFLAPGDPGEDGLLQLREIVALDLGGKLVILSACSSVSGELTAGEGVFGLARGLFIAGARAVLGSLWPLRDDEAAILVDDFAAQLGRGASIATALAAARRGRIAAGAPSAAWAGLVVLGDADFAPLPGGREPPDRWPRWGGSRGLLVLLAGLVVLTGLSLACTVRPS